LEKIDRLGWAAGLSLLSYGVRVGVRVSDRAILKGVLERLPPGWKPAASPSVSKLYSLIGGGDGHGRGVRRLSILYGDAARLARSRELEQALDTLESDLQMYIAEMSPRRVFIHAGAVGWRGRAIVIPGRSLSGKTSLVAALVRAGATYYSDEYAVLDARGRVHPFPRRLGIREDGPTQRTTRYAVEEIGGKPGSTPLPVGMVILSTYRSGARWRARRLSAGRAALDLLAHTVSVRRQPEPALATIQRVVVRAPVLKGVRGEAQEAVDFIVRTLGD
jgi:hypothetical protein